MLDQNNHQGKFGADYVRVLASAAGLLWSQDDLDFDTVDLCLKVPGRTPRGFSPRIDVQVKTVRRLDVSGGAIHYGRLNHAQFNNLAGTDFVVPRYLFVVHVPPSTARYADLSTYGLLLRHIGYYVSLSDRQPMPVPDPNRHVGVKIPLTNVLTANSLRRLVTGNVVFPVG
ncbi:DUF4365 domain-containing protein [Nocardia macrotermitis]|uniref:DUF4365 domain-containing protein n=1 Tax=Nocardia macrotermitis TaxID=2585198 RepID=A0A7K0D4B3_9NOCA|nr:DUF4365 domain-containing protein [Nocardia macrotermitis]MQY20162.1 hypothetical protein [Nocardia macrotermitis]